MDNVKVYSVAIPFDPGQVSTHLNSFHEAKRDTEIVAIPFDPGQVST